MIRFLLKNFFLSLVLLSLILDSCTPKTQHSAQDLFQKAQTAYTQDSINLARILIDSIHTTYKTDLAVRKQADTLSYKIEQFISQRNIHYLDSLSQKNTEALTAAFKDFNFKKEEKYEDIGRYIPRKSDREVSSERAFVKPYCDERGQRFLQVYYHGSTQQHNRLELRANDTKSETSVLNTGSITRYKNQGTSYEILLFNEAELLDIYDFVALNETDPIKITLLGSSPYTFRLSSSERQGFLLVQHLSTLLKNQDELSKQLVRNQNKLVILQKKLN